MAKITFKGNEIITSGELPTMGSAAKDFILTGEDLSDVTLGHFSSKVKILNIVPSLDTDVCATSTRKFNEAISQLNNVVVLAISADLPFAQKRFCETTALKNVIPLSSFRSSFADEYGLRINSGKLLGLNSRAVIIINKDNKIIYTEQVPEITQEPNYEAAMSALKKELDQS